GAPVDRPPGRDAALGCNRAALGDRSARPAAAGRNHLNLVILVVIIVVVVFVLVFVVGALWHAHRQTSVFSLRIIMNVTYCVRGWQALTCPGNSAIIGKVQSRGREPPGGRGCYGTVRSLGICSTSMVADPDSAAAGAADQPACAASVAVS